MKKAKKTSFKSPEKQCLFLQKTVRDLEETVQKNVLAIQSKDQVVLTIKRELETKDQEFSKTITRHKTVITKHKTAIKKRDQIIAEKEAHISRLFDQLKLAYSRQYGRKSEQATADQLQLFNEAEATVSEEAEKESSIEIAAHKRKKRGRRPLPKNLPREIIIHDLEESERVCTCGNPLHKIGEDRSEQLDYVPATLKVIEHIRSKYACNKCHTVKMAPIPKQPIPKSMASTGLLSQVITSKYVDHLPLYRQSNIFKRLKIDLSRSTLSHWVLKCAELFEPLVVLMKESMRTGSYTHCDETPLIVLNPQKSENPGQGKKKRKKCWMFVYVSGPPGNGMVIYDYQTSRSCDSVKIVLKDFKGYLQTDAYSGYKSAYSKDDDVELVFCWAHARRKFYDIVKITKQIGAAHEAMNTIRKLYQIEKMAKQQTLSYEEIKTLRKEKSKPILASFEKWLKKKYSQTPPKGSLGKAIAYSLNHWEELTRYLEDGRLEIDNNRAERAIRPFAVGRKNWLFANTSRGAKASATIYSLVMTCKENQVEPYHYLKHILTQLPYCETDEDREKLLPSNYKSHLENQTQKI